MDTPHTSIILPVYNSEKTLALCLDSLVSLDYPNEKLEIIVVNNNSTDTTRDIIGRYRVKYLFEPKKGAPAALNTGIQNSHGEIIAFTHSDCAVEKNWIKNIVKGFTESNIGGCGGEVLSYNPRSWIERYCDYRRLHFQNGNVAKGESFLPWVILANAAFRRKVLDEAGLFDEFFTEEYDIDLSWRVYLKGSQLKYVPEAITHHKHRDTLVGLWKQYFKIGYNSPRFVKKYGKVYRSLFVVPYKSFPYIFWQVLCGFGIFFRNLFVKKDRLGIIYPLLDNIVYSALFLGGVFGWMRLRFQ